MSELIELTNYISRGITPKYTESHDGFGVINQRCIRNGVIDFSLVRNTDLTKKKVSEEKKLKKYDVLINSTGDGTLGRVSQYFGEDNKYTVDTHITIVRPNCSLINPVFLGFNLFSKQRFIEKLAEGSTGQLELPRINVSNIEVDDDVDKELQDLFASLLLNIQNKITLLQQQNQDLEELAQTLFKRWFMEFEFPNENGEPYKSSGGKMVESEFGEIPEGWNISLLQDVTTLVSRGISPKYMEEGGICVLNQRCIRDKSIDFSIGRRHNNELKNAHSKFIKLFDVLVNSTGDGTLGRTAIVKRIEEEPTTVDSHVSIIRANNKINKYFLTYLITGKEREIERMAEGTTGQTELSRSKLNEMEVLIPIKELQDKFGEISLCHNQKISMNEQEIQTLTQLRDTLLPKLMSGELRVKKQERNN